MPKAETYQGITYPHNFDFIGTAAKDIVEIYDEEEKLRFGTVGKKGKLRVAHSVWDELFKKYPRIEQRGRELQAAFATADYYTNIVEEGALVSSAAFAYFSDISGLQTQYVLRDILLARCFPPFNEAEADSHYEQSKPLIDKIAALALDISRINVEGDTHASYRIHHLLSQTSPMSREVRQIHQELAGHMHSPFYHRTLRATDVIGAALTGSLRATEAQRPLYVVKSSVENAQEMNETSQNR